MLNMWFVEEGARVEEWDKLCEMQSDKAAVEISANYPGVIKKLYAQANDMVKTGAPLADIDDGVPEGEEVTKVEEPDLRTSEEQRDENKSPSFIDGTYDEIREEKQVAEEGAVRHTESAEVNVKEKFSQGAPLATPAVRGLSKKYNIDISKVNGSGKDGRVMKEDVEACLRHQNMASSCVRSEPSMESGQRETVLPLSPVQTQMFRTMTASLAIPHLLYTDEVNTTHLSSFRRRLNQSRQPSDPKVTLLAFALKAISIALNHYPLLNARLQVTANGSSKAHIVFRSNHNIGIAMDTPVGLLVPVIKNVRALSILDIALEIQRLSELGKAKKLSSADLGGGTITVSNIGNIGGTVVAPVIVDGQLAILGIGKSRIVPVIGEDDAVQKAEITNFSWSADHRVVDGATMARMGSMVKKFMEEPEKLMFQMR